MNGDGFDDVIVGAPDAEGTAGRAYVYFGYLADDDNDGISSDTDCDDTDPAIHPGATEVCDAANTDEDCDGLADDASATGQSSWYADADGDGNGAGPATDACDAPLGYVADDSDCDDTDPAVHPGATEVPGDGIDQDCDGADEHDTAQGEDTAGTDDTSGASVPGEDTGPGSPARPGACGCATGGQSWAAGPLALAILLMGRRRRV